MMMQHAIKRLGRDERGVSAVEFALLAPLFFLFLFGIFDITYQFYGKAVLNGAVEEAGRMATIEANSSDPSALDAAVRAQVNRANKNAVLTFSRKSYKDFTDVGMGEEFTDDNGNGVRDDTECYEDANNNAAWDNDRGAAGNGGAKDVVVYTVSMTYNRIFPMWKMLGQPQSKTITTQTILRNQPFDEQDDTVNVICV
jgi:Flp pilus assembly protein TadG